MRFFNMDMAVFDHDYFTVPEDEIKEIQVKMTLVGGRVVYSRDKATNV